MFYLYGMDTNLIYLRTYRSSFKPLLNNSITENVQTNYIDRNFPWIDYFRTRSIKSLRIKKNDVILLLKNLNNKFSNGN